LVYDCALEAKEGENAPLPVFVPLGGYTDDGPFEVYLARHLGVLAPHLKAYLFSGRLILLLDGLNEMPRASYGRRVGQLRDLLDQYPDGAVMVTCRALDYVVELEQLQKVEVSPLDDDRVWAFLRNYLGDIAAKRLFRILADESTETSQHERSAEKRSSLLELCRGPYMLLMTAQVYATTGGSLPTNRGRMFAAFVDTLLAREKERCAEAEWIKAELQQDGLAALAYAMQREGEWGTTVARDWALAHLCRAAPHCNAEKLLYLATSASLLDPDDGTLRFYHQLLQEYFAARELGRQVNAGESLTQYWSEGWWAPSDWEETFLLLAGMEGDASALLVKLADANPVVAGRCLLEGGADADEAARSKVIEVLVSALSNEELPPTARVQAGDVLGRLGDPRPGVGLRDDGLPDIFWCEVPAGPFLMGSAQETHPDAYDQKTPQHEVWLPAFKIARYPISNVQYDTFVRDGGYTERWHGCWTDVGWQKKDKTRPDTYGGVYDLPNHPVVGVTWYEALAFCQWLTARLREVGEIDEEWQVRLPSEAEWEKAARGTDGRSYPWGDEADPNRANWLDTGIHTTSAVGCFPGGVSPYGVLDMSGNVWEWTQSLWGKDGGEPEFTYPYDPTDGRENLNAPDEVARVARGASWWDYFRLGGRCACRFGNYPENLSQNYGFRVVASLIS
jgi:formylglycine-generating enzyme required for sulfatase activity